MSSLKDIAPSLKNLKHPLVQKRLQSWDQFYKRNPNTGVNEVKADDAKSSKTSKRP